MHRALFLHNEQPQGIPALLTRFHEGKAIKEFLHAHLVGGANVAFAYVRLHRPNLNLERVMGGLPEEEDYASTLAAAKQVIGQVQRQTECLVGPLDAPKDEPVD